jgi:hypothetical protein
VVEDTSVCTFQVERSWTFLEGLACKVERLIPEGEVRQAQWRTKSTAGQVRAYHVLDFNCEHFADFIAGATKPESSQVTGLAVLCLFGVLLAIMSN